MKKSASLFVAVSLAVSACSKAESNQATEGASQPSDAPVSVASATPVSNAGSADAPHIKVYKDPNCGCCKAWIQHLEQNGFVVEVMDMPDLSAVKSKYGVKQEIQACHTGVVNGYAIEGHVPADVILRMLKEKPAIAGLAVPGMPAGSPGMEGAIKEKYDVLTFDRAGRTTVYATR